MSQRSTVFVMCAGVGSEELHQECAAVHSGAAAQQPAADCALPGPRARRDSEHGADTAPPAGPLLPLPWCIHPHWSAPLDMCRKLEIHILCYVMLCYVMLCYVMLCYVMLCYVMLCYVMLCYVVLHCIVLYCIVLYCIVLYCIVLYCIVLYCIVLYCIVLYCIVLYCIYHILFFLLEMLKNWPLGSLVFLSN